MVGFTEAIGECACLMATAESVVACSTGQLPALGANQVRVKTEVSLVSPGTELHRIQGTHTQKSTYPRATGYIAVGVIVGKGASVEGLELGQRVLVNQNHSAYLNAEAGKVLEVPEGVEAVDAAAVTILAIALRGVRGGEVRFGDSVAIFGLGMVGLFAAHLAKLSGAFPVIGVDLLANRRKAGRVMGVDVTIDPAAGETGKMIADATGGEGCRVCIDASGTTRIMPMLAEMAAEFGKLVVLGGVHGSTPLDLYTHFQKRNLTMIGCGSPYPKDYPFDERRNELVLMGMIRGGQVRPRPAITHIVSWQRGPEMYERLMKEKEQVIGVAFDWTGAEMAGA